MSHLHASKPSEVFALQAPLRERLRSPALAAAAALGVGAALLVRDPHTAGSWGFCPFLLLTGHPCPACGGLRATNDLLRGDVAAALSSNAYTVLTIIGAIAVWVLWVARRVQGRALPTALTARVASWWLAGLMAFGVLRFVPGLTALQP